MRGTSIVVAVVIVLLFSGCTGLFGSSNPSNTTGLNNSQNGSVNQTTPAVSDCLGPVCGADQQTYATDCEALLAKVAVLYPGECKVEPTCMDTDDGIKPETAGTVTKGNETHADYCLDASQLIEYSCLDNKITMASITCQNGKECKDGACVVKVEPKPPEIPSGCTGVSAPNVSRSDSITFNGSSYSDICVDYRTVKDYFCKDNSISSVNHECDEGSGCQDGRCIKLQLSCTDSDYGNDTTVKGQVIQSRGLLSSLSEWDSCKDEATLNEYDCGADNEIVLSVIDCGSGRKCANGRCVRSKCSEDDNGNDIYETGTTTVDGGVEYRDSCIGDNTVREYFCHADDAWSDDIVCPSNYTCSGGRCVPK